MKQEMKLNYGIDAPKVITNLFIITPLLFGSSILFLHFSIADIIKTIGLIGLWGGGAVCFLEGILMIVYARNGKFRHRDRILNLVDWRGDETVLDVGTGLGLLMNGAAKRLTTGKCIGIEIWNKKDLSSNSYQQAILNSKSEGVADKIEIRYQNILDTSFQDKSFDIILSNLCLHNIYSSNKRKLACRELYRILKQNGLVIISDFRFTDQYRKEFENLGMITEKIVKYYFDTFPPLTIIKAVKK
jgi:arsenite methyltransferase